ncbi:MAG: anti-sigma factor antagonist [Planctomycetaceae bacterium]|nr:anti-sigma factor antagonist [Planctomycetaceae bacterium]
MPTPDAESPAVEIRRLGAVTVVTLLDKRVLGARGTSLFEDHLLPLADTLGGDSLVLDFSRVTYFGSDSVGRLVQLAGRVDRSHGWLTLCHVDEKIREVFRVTRLDTTFDIVDDLVTAIGSNRPTEPG